MRTPHTTPFGLMNERMELSWRVKHTACENPIVVVAVEQSFEYLCNSLVHFPLFSKSHNFEVVKLLPSSTILN
jgi:hypothetical protein